MHFIFFIKDFIHHTCGFLSWVDRMQFLFANPRLRTQQSSYHTFSAKKIIDEHLTLLGFDTVSLFQMLIDSNSYISGSFLISVLHGQPFECGDIDIFISDPHDGSRLVLPCLMELYGSPGTLSDVDKCRYTHKYDQGFTLSTSGYGSQHVMVKGDTIKTCIGLNQMDEDYILSFQTYTSYHYQFAKLKLPVNLIWVPQALLWVTKFDLDFCKVAYRGEKVHIYVLEAFMMKACVAYQSVQLSRLEKYQARGFTIHRRW
jgi:hypothetical protein